MDRYALSPSDLDAAKSKLRDAWRQANPGREDDEMPEPLRAADPDVERPTRDFLTRLRELLKGSVSAEVFDDAWRKARGHAGGAATARKRKMKPAAYREHAARHPEPVAGCEYCGDCYAGPEYRLPKDDARVNYRMGDLAGVAEGVAAYAESESCYGCRFYGWGSCQLVEGTIEAPYVCDLHLAPPQTYPSVMLHDVAGDGRGVRLFLEQPAGFADAPEWINVLPKPGTYTHPSYGEIAITPERNARFVSNFDAKVYQRDLPITLDIEHDGTMSGGIGYVEAMRVNADGSVDAQVGWTDVGQTLLAEDRFKYFSPQWWDEWKRPGTGEVFRDVLIGGAICVRPFFKENALRPLVASETWGGGLFEVEPRGADPDLVWIRPLAAVEGEARKGTDVGDQDKSGAAGAVTLTEAEHARLMGLAEKVEAAETARVAAEAAQAAQAAEIAALKTANEKTERDLRDKRFRDVVLGRGGGAGDGAVWVGEIDVNVAHLHRFADVYGEESEEFKAEVARGNAQAATFKEAGLLTSIGSAEPGAADGGSAWDRIQAKAKAMTDADPTLTQAQAIERVAESDPQLYREHTREVRGR